MCGRLYWQLKNEIKKGKKTEKSNRNTYVASRCRVENNKMDDVDADAIFIIIRRHFFFVFYKKKITKNIIVCQIHLYK